MNTRLIAARVLAKVLQQGSSLTAALDAVLPSIGSAKDRAFVQALCYGVLRHFHRLDYILGQLLDKPLTDPEVKALVLLGLYQLKFMRVKTHAAVSETVLAARKKVWAKSLVNALLRTYLREQDVLEKQADLVESAATSHPNWLISRIAEDWPGQAAQVFIENNQQPPMMLRVNLSKTSRDEYLQLLLQHGLVATPVGFCPSALLLENPVGVEMLPAFAEGWVSVQDAAAQLAAGLLAAAPGQRVLDVCAAPGGKTAHILEMEPELTSLVAIDIDAQRMQRVQEGLQRLGLTAALKVGDAAKPNDWWDGFAFDRILLDAPCSATGVIRRHPDIKLLRKPADIESLRLLQKTILAAVWPLLVEGGILLYATCSVLKQENEEQITDFLASHPDAELLPIAASWGQNRTCGRQILVGDQGMDGFYYAKVGKKQAVTVSGP